jgi:hypothetical protein
MRRIAVLVVLVLAGAFVLAVPTLARGATAAQPAPGVAVRADFNGDTFADLAVGVPGESVGAVQGAGAVNVLYGSANGLTGTNSDLFTQANGAGRVETGDGFGAALASGDFNGDGFADLAVGAPFEAVGSIQDAGAVSVLFGTSAGLSGAGSRSLTQAPSLPETGDEFGEALAAGDLDNDGNDELIIGAPFEDIGSIVDAGLIHIAPGPGLGPLEQFGQPVSAQETGDVFGWSVASGDVNGDNFSDVVAGAPFENVGSVVSAGAVSVLRGSANGVTTANAQTLTQPVSAVEVDDTFGWSVATGDFDGNAFSDVAAGAAFEDVGRVVDAGAVSVLHGSTNGLTTTGAQTLTQPISAVETGDTFGWSVATGNLNGGGADDLAVGAPFEAVGTRVSAGAVSALYSDGGVFSAANAQTFTQVGGSVEADDTFGWSLAAGNYNGAGADDLGAGAPFEDVGSVLDAGAVSEVPGSAAGLDIGGGTLFTQNTAGVPSVAEVGDSFGGSLAAAQPASAMTAAGQAPGAVRSASRVRRAAAGG